MAEKDLKHRLAALLSADVVGYSRLMSEDEISTVRSLAVCRKEIYSKVGESDGRVVDFIGDNFLAEFPSANISITPTPIYKMLRLSSHLGRNIYIMHSHNAG